MGGDEQQHVPPATGTQGQPRTPLTTRELPGSSGTSRGSGAQNLAPSSLPARVPMTSLEATATKPSTQQTPEVPKSAGNLPLQVMQLQPEDADPLALAETLDLDNMEISELTVGDVQGASLNSKQVTFLFDWTWRPLSWMPFLMPNAVK